MRILSLLLLVSTILFSKVYYSKVEPYEVRDISSNVKTANKLLTIDCLAPAWIKSLKQKIEKNLHNEK